MSHGVLGEKWKPGQPDQHEMAHTNHPHIAQSEIQISGIQCFSDVDELLITFASHTFLSD